MIRVSKDLELEEKWQQANLMPQATIRDAISNLEKTGLRIAVVTDDLGTLIGIVTDGDIRRGLLTGASIDETLIDYINRSPLKITGNLEVGDVFEFMIKSRLSAAPLCDESNRIRGIYVMSTKPANTLDVHLFVLAGGRGERLKPYTNTTPKPMVDVNGKPILEHILLSAKRQGVKRVTISLGYLGEQISDYFGTGERIDLEIDYVREEAPLGTAGPLGLLSKEKMAEKLLVINGDIISNLDLALLLDYHNTNKSDATMAARKYEIQNPFGVLHTEGNHLVSIVEKPIYKEHINAGIYVFNKSCVEQLNGNKAIDMPEFFSKLIEQEKTVLIYPLHENWIDIGRGADLEFARNNMRDSL